MCAQSMQKVCFDVACDLKKDEGQSHPKKIKRNILQDAREKNDVKRNVGTKKKSTKC